MSKVEPQSKVRMYAWASPSLKWFNFIPSGFGSQNRFFKYLRELKQKQKQTMIDEIEAKGYQVLEYVDTDFISAVKVADTDIK